MAAALEAVNAAKDRGVDTIFDPTAMFGGRDVRFMQRVAEETGVRIVACTGIYTYDYLPHFFENRSEDQIAEIFVDDIEKGIQGTDAKAGFLKCAADEPGMTPTSRRSTARSPARACRPARRSWPTRGPRPTPARGR